MALIFNFTKARLDKLEEGRYKDSTTPSLWIRATPTGQKNFYCQVYHKNKRFMENIGSYPTISIDSAREQSAQKADHFIKHGKVKPEEKKVQKTVLNDVFDLFERVHYPKLKESTLRDYRNHIQKFREYKPTPRSLPWGERTELSKTEIEDWYFQCIEETPVQANRMLASLSSALTQGVRREIWPSNPAILIDKEKEHSRNQRVSMDILNEVLDHAKSIPTREHLFLRFLIMTASRRGEMLSMRKKDIKDGVWVKPTTKNKRQHQVRLDDDTNALFLEYTEEMEDDDKVFIAYEPKYTWARAQAAVEGLDIRMHDVRRSVATSLLTSGTSIEQVSALLNHSDISVTQKVYAEFITDQSDAINKIGELLSKTSD